MNPRPPPQLHLIEDVEKGKEAIISTKRFHNYWTGQKIKVTIPIEYGFEISCVTTIKVVDCKRFKTDIDTSRLPYFYQWKPPYYKAYTPAQCMPQLSEE